VLLALLVTIRNRPSTAAAAETGRVPTEYGDPLSSVRCPVVPFSTNAETVLEL